MLEKISAFDSLKKATEFLSYIDSSAPKVSLDLVKELLSLLSDSISSDFNYFAISTFFLTYFNKLDLYSQEVLFNLLQDDLDNINPDLQQAFKETLGQKSEYKHIYYSHELESKAKSLILHENVTLNHRVFEYMAKHRTLLPNQIIKYIDQISTLPKTELLDNINSILMIISSTAYHEEIFTKLYNIIEKHDFWLFLSFDSIVNLLLISISLPNPPKLPLHFLSTFASIINSSASLEDLQQNPKNNLQYYRNFYYNTELEPRQIVSNDIKLRKFIPEISIIPKIPLKEIFNNAKINAIYNQFQKNVPEEVKSSLELYYKNRDSDIKYNDFKNKFQSDLQKFFEDEKKIQGFNINAFDPKIGWRYDFFFQERKTALMVYTHLDCYFIEHDKKELNLLQTLIINQIEKISVIAVYAIHDDLWNKLQLAEKSAFLQKIFLIK